MKGFVVKTTADIAIHFRYYEKEAPLTVAGFKRLLPFARTFYHARVSGQEIWIDDVPGLDVIQENASVFTAPGEVVIGPAQGKRARTVGCFGIYYGEGKGLDCANIFAVVEEEDRQALSELGAAIWKYGAQELSIESWD